MGIQGDDFTIMDEAIATLKEGDLGRYSALQGAVESTRTPVRLPVSSLVWFFE